MNNNDITITTAVNTIPYITYSNPGGITGTYVTSGTSNAIINNNNTAKIVSTNKNIQICENEGSEFKKIQELVPFKVYRFTFTDGNVIKTICSDEDSFDLEYAFYLALAKKLFSNTFTFEGVLHQAEKLKYQKHYAKLVKKGIKLFYNNQLEKAKKEEEERLKEEQRKRRIDKKKTRKAKCKEQKLDELYNIISKAIIDTKK